MNKPAYAHEQSLFGAPTISADFSPAAEVVVAPGDCFETLRTLPRDSMQLIITSPPYNIGKDYEKATQLDPGLFTIPMLIP